MRWNGAQRPQLPGGVLDVFGQTPREAPHLNGAQGGDIQVATRRPLVGSNGRPGVLQVRLDSPRSAETQRGDPALSGCGLLSLWPQFPFGPQKPVLAGYPGFWDR